MTNTTNFIKFADQQKMMYSDTHKESITNYGSRPFTKQQAQSPKRAGKTLPGSPTYCKPTTMQITSSNHSRTEIRLQETEKDHIPHQRISISKL
jgi:hypothetical protein